MDFNSPHPKKRCRAAVPTRCPYHGQARIYERINDAITNLDWNAYQESRDLAVHTPYGQYPAWDASDVEPFGFCRKRKAYPTVTDATNALYYINTYNDNSHRPKVEKSWYYCWDHKCYHLSSLAVPQERELLRREYLSRQGIVEK